jgi:hypothetical protein
MAGIWEKSGRPFPGYYPNRMGAAGSCSVAAQSYGVFERKPVPDLDGVDAGPHEENASKQKAKLASDFKSATISF